jgi:hypothetical protein
MVKNGKKMKPNLSNWRILEASKEVRDIWNSQEDH